MGLGFMNDEKLVFCSSCGENVKEGKYCPKCGSFLGSSPLQEIDDQLNRMKTIKDKSDNFENNIAKQLSQDFQEQFNRIKDDISNLSQRLEKLRTFIAGTAKDKDKKKTICPNCGSEVEKTRFCSSCGNFLGEQLDDEYQQLVDFTTTIINRMTNFQTSVGKILSQEAVLDLAVISKQLQLINNRFQLKLKIFGEPAPKVTQKPVKMFTPVSVKAQREPKPKKIETQPITTTPTERPITFWSKLEKNLLNYWFFYLAIILFSVGISITLYFVVAEMQSAGAQLGVIYAIGAAIILIGELLAIIFKVRDKKKSQQEQTIADEGKSEKLGFLPEMSSVIIFIGFIVILVGGFVGIISYESLGVSKAIFIFLGYGLCLVSLVLGVLNNSELLALNGILQAIILTAVDLLWEQYTAILGNITSLIVFILLVIISTLLAIFFKKWTGSVAVMSIVPVFLCIPKLASKVGLDFLILFLIPIMMVLVVRFGSSNIPVPMRRSITILSMLLPSLALIAITSINKAIPISEPDWAQFYTFEVFIACLPILGSAYYYQFIQEEYLAKSPTDNTIWFFGLLFTGIVSFITVGLFQNTITTSLFFVTFFVFGILSVLKVLQQHLSAVNVVMSFLFSEIQAILLITLVETSTVVDNILLFILGISFVLLAIISLFLPGSFHQANSLFVIWNFVSALNVLLLGLLDTINDWYIFVSLLIMLSCSLIANLPITIPKVERWRQFSITSLLINAILIVVLLLTHNLDFFSFAPLVIFIIYLLVSVPAFFNWKLEEGIVNE